MFLISSAPPIPPPIPPLFEALIPLPGLLADEAATLT